MNEITYTFKTPISLHLKDGNGGATQDLVSEVVLRAPSAAQIREFSKLKQSIVRAGAEADLRNKSIANTGSSATSAPKHTEEEESDLSADEMGEAYLMIVCSSEKVNLDELFKIFENLIEAGCCDLNLHNKMTKTIFRSLSAEDAYSLLGCYIGNFIMASRT